MYIFVSFYVFYLIFLNNINMLDEENSYMRHSWSEPESEPESYGSIDSDYYPGYNIPVNCTPVEYDFHIYYVIGEGMKMRVLG